MQSALWAPLRFCERDHNLKCVCVYLLTRVCVCLWIIKSSITTRISGRNPAKVRTDWNPFIVRRAMKEREEIWVLLSSDASVPAGAGIDGCMERWVVNRRVAFEYVLLTDWRRPAWQAETGGRWDGEGGEEPGGWIMDEWADFGSGVLARGCVLLTAKLPAAGVTQQHSQPGVTPPFLLL